MIRVLKKHRFLILMFIAVTAVACSEAYDDDSDSALNAVSEAPSSEAGGECVYEHLPLVTTGRHAIDLRDCVKLEGGQIGQDTTIDVDGTSVTISDWQNKEGEGDMIGFSLETDAPIGYVVKAGTSLFESTDATWVHPAGTSGPEAKGISFVAFCDPGEPHCPDDGGSGDSAPTPSSDDDPTPGGDDSTPGGDDSTSGGDDSTSGGDGSTDGGTCETSGCSADAECSSADSYCVDGCCQVIYL